MNRVTIILEIEVPEEELHRLRIEPQEYILPAISIGGHLLEAIRPVQITQIEEERTDDGAYIPYPYRNQGYMEVIPPSYHRKIYLS